MYLDITHIWRAPSCVPTKEVHFTKHLFNWRRQKTLGYNCIQIKQTFNIFIQNSEIERLKQNKTSVKKDFLK